MGLAKLRIFFNVARVRRRHTQSEVPSPFPIGKMHKQGLLSCGDVH
jgi:hypothetical protein